jgi:hypothetical protein
LDGDDARSKVALLTLAEEFEREAENAEADTARKASRISASSSGSVSAISTFMENS